MCESMPEHLRSAWDHAAPQGGVLLAAAATQTSLWTTIAAGLIVALINVGLKWLLWQRVRSQTQQDERDSRDAWRRVRQTIVTPDPDRPCDSRSANS